MILSKSELLDLFEEAFVQESAASDLTKQADAIKKAAASLLDGFATSNEIAKKTMKNAYTAFKNFKTGKVSTDDEDYFTMLEILEEHFAAEKDPNAADTVSA